jgi:uncharacterized paraquat-inducible protein A
MTTSPMWRCPTCNTLTLPVPERCPNCNTNLMVPKQRMMQHERAEERQRRQTNAAQQWAKPTTKIKAAGLTVLFIGVRIISALKRGRAA